ncbi:MAG: hypothetical protein ACI9UA_004331, partial [Pseudoalteromonas tetraodonis]
MREEAWDVGCENVVGVVDAIHGVQLRATLEHRDASLILS